MTEALPPTRNPLKRLYRWVLSWADRPGGTWALFFLSMAESSFFPIPPDPLQIALSMAKPRRAFWYALVSMVASVIGGIIGYAIGFYLWEHAGLKEFFFSYVFSPELFEKVKLKYQEHAALAVFGAAFTPIPYKVFTIAAGVCVINFPIFVGASIVGRGGRFFLVATLMYFFGERAATFVEKHFEWLTLAFFVLVIGGFVAIKYLL